ncbi:MAG: two-component regulator propeller domain-containing protein [Bacteroidota bacterium]
MLGRLNVVIFAFLLQAGNSRVLSQNFIELTVEDGLSQGFVSSISQDRNGYIWIGTLHGLNRYLIQTETSGWMTRRMELFRCIKSTRLKAHYLIRL